MSKENEDLDETMKKLIKAAGFRDNDILLKIMHLMNKGVKTNIRISNAIFKKWESLYKDINTDGQSLSFSDLMIKSNVSPYLETFYIAIDKNFYDDFVKIYDLVNLQSKTSVSCMSPLISFQ